MSRTDLKAATLADYLRQMCGDGSVEWCYEPMQTSVLLDMADMLDEVAKLRELVSILSVINKNMSQCNVTDCNQCPVSNECNESVYLEGLLGIDTKEISWRVQWRNEDSSDTQKENAKLLELIVDVHDALCSDKLGMFHKLTLASMEDDMRELGIEVTE